MKFATDIFSSKVLCDLDIYREIFEKGATAIIIFNEDLNICYVNQRCAELLGRTSCELLDVPYIDFIDPKEKEFSLELVDKISKGKLDKGGHLRRLISPDGETIWTQIYLQKIEKDDTRYFLAQIIDISPNIKTKQALIDIEQQVQMAFGAAPIGMALVAKDGKLQKVNKQLCELLNYSEEEILQLHFMDLLHPDDLEESIEEYKQMLADKIEIVPDANKRFIDSKGNSIWVSRSVAMVRPEKQPFYFILQVQDRTIQHNLEEELFRLAYRDHLTGIGNRAALVKHITDYISQKRPVGLILLDLDNFKYINDSLAHAAGDILLVEFSKRVKDCVGLAGFLGRLGGDEFVVALPEASFELLNEIASRILKAASIPFELLGYQLAISASIGVTEFFDEIKGQSSDVLGELLRRADLALYSAKDFGKGQICFFDPYMYEQLFERLDLETALRHVLDQNGLEVEYEPIFDLQSGTCVALEALCRWNDKKMGLIPREKFIPLAEQTGLIFQIEEFILRQGCKEVSQLSKQIGRDIGICVHISSLQLDQIGFDLLVTDIVCSAGISPSQVTILKEEEVYSKSFQIIHDNLFGLSQAGMVISLDDFGTGYSCLEHLDNCVVGQIKIGSYFVSKITSKSKPALLESIFSISEAIGAKVAAKGITTDGQLKNLRKMGCELGQGYFLGPIGPISSMSFAVEKILA